MTMRLFLGFVVLAIVVGWVVGAEYKVQAGEVGGNTDYKVLAPIRHGNLTVFPVVASSTHDTKEFLTLDEGLKSGEVEVTESGNVRGMIRPRHPNANVEPQYPVHDGAQVNKLVLVNNSKRPLLLLAGEIVTGGKQDRVIGKDRIVLPESDPIDLDVFCVEPGRWVGPSAKFVPGAASSVMAAPSVRGKAMADKDQAKVWQQVGSANEMVTVEVQAAAPSTSTTRELSSTTSYAKVMQNDEVKSRVDSVAKPIEEQYESTIKQLREKNAVGVIVAVNGQIVWADIFASTSLLEKYWPKLVRSYATDAIVTRAKGGQPSEASAQAFLEDLHGRHETIDSEPGVYRHTEVSGDGFKAFELTSLLPKTNFSVHVAKMAE
jgi:hypothetical protein